LTQRDSLRRRLARAYFLFQAAAVTAWWIVLATVPHTRPLFSIRGASFAAVSAFAAGDLVVIALGSALVASSRIHRRSVVFSLVVTGAVIYAALYTAAAALLRLTPVWGTVLMIPAAALTIVSASIISRDEPAESVSTSAST
jgi:hypothetical protein